MKLASAFAVHPRDSWDCKIMSRHLGQIFHCGAKRKNRSCNVLVKYRVLEMTMDFLAAARDLHASMAVQMRKRVGGSRHLDFFQISSIEAEGKVSPNL